MTVRKKVEKTARKIVSDNALLLEIGKDLASYDAVNLAEALEGFGAKASTYLLSDDERWERWIPMGRNDVCIPFLVADSIAAILFSLPRGGKKGPRKQWSKDIRSLALNGLLDGNPIRALAREISELTGQSLDSARRRLQEINAGDLLKELRRMREAPEKLQKSTTGNRKNLQRPRKVKDRNGAN